MRPLLALTCGLALASLGGCRAPAQQSAGNHLIGAHNMWANQAFGDMAVRAAVVRERTLYPHHFAEGSDQLNQLGRRDLTLLADLFREQPGSLGVRRGDADEVLYQARLESVRTALELAGIDAARVDLVDRPAGGDGVGSQRAVGVLEAGTALDLPAGSARAGTEERQ